MIQKISSSLEELPFQVYRNDREDFVHWIKSQFPSMAAITRKGTGRRDSFKRRLPEVHQGAMSILNKIISSYNPESNLHKYYRPHFEELPKAFESGDVIQYAHALDKFLHSLDWEQ